MMLIFLPSLCKASSMNDGNGTFGWAYHGNENNYGSGGHKKPKAPLDGGLSLLAAAGIGYGIKKYKGKKQQVKMTEK